MTLKQFFVFLHEHDYISYDNLYKVFEIFNDDDGIKCNYKKKFDMQNGNVNIDSYLYNPASIVHFYFDWKKCEKTFNFNPEFFYNLWETLRSNNNKVINFLENEIKAMDTDTV